MEFPKDRVKAIVTKPAFQQAGHSMGVQKHILYFHEMLMHHSPCMRCRTLPLAIPDLLG